MYIKLLYTGKNLSAIVVPDLSNWVIFLLWKKFGILINYMLTFFRYMKIYSKLGVIYRPTAIDEICNTPVTGCSAI